MTGELHMNINLSNLNILIVYVTFPNSNFYFVYDFLTTSATVDWSQDPLQRIWSWKYILICEFYLADQDLKLELFGVTTLTQGLKITKKGRCENFILSENKVRVLIFLNMLVVIGLWIFLCLRNSENPVYGSTDIWMGLHSMTCFPSSSFVLS